MKANVGSGGQRSAMRIVFNLNELPNYEIDENFGTKPTDFGDENGDLASNFFEPFVGRCFLSEEEAFVFYQNFAKTHGFAIRRGQFINDNGEKKRRDFFCHRKGGPPTKFFYPSKEQKK